jgi:glycosyltransferase involved in cell wall biosynthesis
MVMTDLHVPLVSIIMPAFNAEAFIADAIQSALQQSWGNLELIIINDGSTDDTEKIVQSFRDTRIKYIRQENKGVSVARNKGLDAASGKYLAFLDSDDILPSDSLKSRVEILEKNPESRFCDGRVVVFDQIMMNKISEWQPTSNDPDNLLFDLLTLKGNVFFGLTWMIRNQTQSMVQFKPGLTHGEDLLYLIEEVMRGGKYIHTDETILLVRRGHASAMKNLKGLDNGYRQIADELNKIDKIPKRLIETYKSKVRNIMFKSYLGVGKPFAAIKSIIRR